MSQEQEEERGFPTAAYEIIFPENIGGWSAHKTEELADKAIENAETEAIKNELVRRTDVAQLIQDRLEKQEERVEKYNAFDKLNLNDAKARKQELEDLLEEVAEK